MASIIDDRGRYLADVSFAPTEDDSRLHVERIMQGKGTLLAYYFGRAGRLVQVVIPGMELAGRLSTRWCDGKRRWTVQIAGSAIPAEAAPAAHETGNAPHSAGADVAQPAEAPAHRGS